MTRYEFDWPAIRFIKEVVVLLYEAAYDEYETGLIKTGFFGLIMAVVCLFLFGLTVDYTAMGPLYVVHGHWCTTLVMTCVFFLPFVATAGYGIIRWGIPLFFRALKSCVPRVKKIHVPIDHDYIAKLESELGINHEKI